MNWFPRLHWRSVPFLAVLSLFLISCSEVRNHQSTLSEKASVESWQLRTYPLNQEHLATRWKTASSGDATVDKGFFGIIEYKANFIIPSTFLKESLGVFIGIVGEIDRVFINGVKIGATGSLPPYYRQSFDVHREYMIPDLVIKPNQVNEILIQVYSGYAGDKGITVSNVEIAPHWKLQYLKYNRDLMWYFLKLGIPSLCLFTALVSMPWISAGFQLYQHILLALTGVTYFIFGFGRSKLLLHFFLPVTAGRIIVLSAMLGLVFIFLYAMSIARMKKAWQYFLAVGVPAIFAFRILFENNPTLHWAKVQEWFWVSIPLHFIIIGTAIWRAKNQPVWIRAGLALLSIFAINDILIAFNYIRTPRLMDVGFCVVILAMYVKQIFEVKRGWLKLSKKEAELVWSKRFLKMTEKVAHNIRSPVSSVKSALAELKKSMSNYPELKSSCDFEMLELGVAQVEKISSQIMKDYQANQDQAESLQSASTPRLTLLDDLVQKSVLEVKATAPTNIDFALKGFSDFPQSWAVVTPSEIQSALTNVIRNGIEAMENVPERSRRCLTVSWSVSNQSATIDVSDTGKGIAEEVLPKIFEEGFTHEKKDGHGIGLSDAKKTIELNSGTISVNSTVGKGTSVKIKIPCEPSPRWLKTSVNLSGKKSVYFIDENPHALAQWRDKLRTFDFAEDKNLKAFYLYSSKEIAKIDPSESVVILNQNFADDHADGIAWMKQLNSLPEVYLCTAAYDDPKIQQQVKQMGMALIPKPMIQGVEFVV